VLASASRSRRFAMLDDPVSPCGADPSAGPARRSAERLFFGRTPLVPPSPRHHGPRASGRDAPFLWAARTVGTQFFEADLIWRRALEPRLIESKGL
jgi:hypothetical protein